MTPISSGNNNNKNSGGGGISNWMSWTLGRDKRKGSHPIPQHELRHGGLWSGRGQASSTTESSSSSASLTPSPHDQVTICHIMCLSMTLFSQRHTNVESTVGFSVHLITLINHVTSPRRGCGPEAGARRTPAAACLCSRTARTLRAAPAASGQPRQPATPTPPCPGPGPRSPGGQR